MATDDYLNFDLAIEPHAGGYRASVTASPGGDATQSFELPFTAEGLENLVLKLGRSRTVVRRVATGYGKLAERFGEQLYEAVMAGTVGLAYHTSVQEAERQGKGLRLRLNLDRSPELADVPWELLYSPTLHRPLVLSSRTPIVRYISLPFAAKPLTIEAPLKVLVVVAAPTDLVELDTDAEVARIEEATEDLTSAGLLHLDLLRQATLTDLVRRLEQTTCHVLHFVGHGGYEERGPSGSGVLAFENTDRLHHLVPGDKLGLLLHDHASLRLAVLNACEGARTSPTEPFSGVAQSLVRQGVPAVIAMQFEVTDTAATVFGHELYRALADGCTIDRATAIARRGMLAGNHDVEWATPVVYLRSTDGRLFDVRSDVESRPDPVDAELVGWYDDAKEALSTWASTRSPDCLDDAVALLEQVVARKGDFRQAAGLLSQARGEWARQLYRVAGEAIAAGDHREADAALDRLDDIAPDHDDPEDLRRAAWIARELDRAQALAAEQRWSEVDQRTDEILARAPEDPQAASLRAQAQRRLRVETPPVSPPRPTSTPSPPPPVEASGPTAPGADAYAEDPGSPTEALQPVAPSRPAAGHLAPTPGGSPAGPTAEPGPEIEGRRRRRVPPVAAAVGLLAAVAIGVNLFAGNGTPDPDPDTETDTTDTDTTDNTPTDSDLPATDFAASYLQAPTIGGDASWADGLDRHPTRYPAEGAEDDPQVSSEWALAWDESALYLTVSVTDDAIDTPYADDPTRLFRGDGINVFFGRDPSGLSEDAPPRDDDIQVMVGPADPAAESAVSGAQFPTGSGPSCADWAFGLGREATEITATSRPTDDGYELVAEIPWSLLGHEPEVGGVYGIIFSVADVDGGSASDAPAARGSRSSHPDRFAAKHCPGQWQTLTLLPG